MTVQIWFQSECGNKNGNLKTAPSSSIVSGVLIGGGPLHPYDVFICGNCAPRVLQPPPPPLTQLRFSFLIHSPLMGHFEQTKMVFFCLILPFFFAYPNNCCKSSFQKTVNNQIARVIFINWLLDKIRIRLFVNTNNWSSLIDDVY